jgi:hypothetical protein
MKYLVKFIFEDEYEQRQERTLTIEGDSLNEITEGANDYADMVEGGGWELIETCFKEV